ncbi:MAG TPA: aldo/keto reductase [Candidatus Acidoferrales bacterium]|jgi:aryl-alcohol dehydrogenase-like predicted oxidoreductase|nr:aldo/keto reductase [Candidatus Acidoferrales bacterium]
MKLHATSEGTQRYAQRFAGRTHETHFRMIADPAAQKSEREQSAQQLAISTVGIGTYLGNPDEATDRAYTEAVIAAVESGFNLVDSAINYRLQRSERSIGAALAELARRGYAREEILLCTKAGFLTPDGTMPADAGAYFEKEFIERGILKAEEIAAGCHSMAPRYLADQLERSLRNLGAECLDVFYLHNPETQLAEISRGDFLARVGAAFMWAESMVSAGKIYAYGMATWNGFRVPPESAEHISLAAVEAMAREIAGDAHHFRFVQLPVNLAMTEALTLPNQELDDKPVTMVEAAGAMGIHLIGSAALLQGRMARKLPDFVARAIGLENDAERALQFARSVPGMAAALVGMSHTEHVRANARLFSLPLLDAEQFAKLFSRGEGA